MTGKSSPTSPEYPEPEAGKTSTTTTTTITTTTHEIKQQRASSKTKPPTSPAVNSLVAVAAAAQRVSLPPKAKAGAAASQPAAVAVAVAPPQPALPRISLPPIDKMAMSTVISPNPMPEQQPKLSMTSKEWVIPPRPKPGRKPATDTPPTKRKAQNRAAQRAFRERRAARVGELEELLDEQKKTQDDKEHELTQKIRDLEMEVQSFRSRCLLLESMLERERQERMRAEMQAETLGRRHGQSSFRNDSISSMPHPTFNQHQLQNQPRRSLPDERLTQQQASRHFSISQIITPPEIVDAQSPHDVSDAPLTCGNCSPTGRCACAEEVLASVVSGCGKCGFGTSCMCLNEAAQQTNQIQDLKRPASPSGQMSDEKRHRPGATAIEPETDFTTMFSKKPATTSSQPPSIMSQLPSADSMSFRDGCGFCKDGTYCVCAEEAAMATPAMTPTDTPSAPPLPPRQTRTPPPSENDVQPPMAMEMTADGAVKLPRRKPKTQVKDASSRGGCGPNGPGTCAQCQADPKSGLFCRLMAANFGREQGKSGEGGGGCCGGKGPGGGCCKSAPKQEKITLPSLPSLGLSCAEAYQTLSSHRNFEKAADDIGSWLPKLKATPKGDPRTTAQSGRMPIEVEAASIMSVLKEFDIRFGRDC
ncbi:bZIP transcription factor hapX [Cladobotryum mycophilum]|uniref:BZIP transcription factor hapX n=1 Tax=Cladobotryum mycophilum TaxID=491253 RepID=A0ABR0SPZ0_9HYPO